MSAQYAVGEWWTGNRIITGKELRTYERRARERATQPTTAEVHEAMERPQRTCRTCGRDYTIRAFEGATPTCPRCRTMAATQARKAKREAAA